MQNDDICHLCAGLLDIKQHKTPETSVAVEVEHHKKFGDLISAGDKCAFCQFLSKNTGLEYLQKRFPELNARNHYEQLDLIWKVKDPSEFDSQIFWMLLELELHVTHRKFINPSVISISTCPATEPCASLPTWRSEGSLSAEEKCSTLRTWMEECDAEHAECKPPRFALPTRLLEVGSSSSTSARLVLTDQLERDHVCYAALSHCWGSRLPLRTTSATMEAFMGAIPVNQLPKTFLDAMAITRSLGIPYLWIDALCIKQDDADDWAAEAARMYEVYAGCVLTIAAASGTHGEHGCFPMSDASVAQESSFQLSGSDENAGLVVKAQPGDVREFLHGLALSNRGWTLQEQILPGRVAHFTDSELHWDCRHLYRTELGLRFIKYNPGQQSLGYGALGISISNLDFEHIWRLLMEKFAFRHFTVSSDRLPALAGIVKHFSLMTGNHHLLACWKETIINDLLWCSSEFFVPGEDKRSGLDELPLPGIPSWSWISRCQEPSFDIWLHTIRIENPDVEPHNETELVESRVVWTGAPLVSTLVEAQLTLDGPIAMVKLAVAPEAFDYRPPYVNAGDEVVSFENNPIPWTCAGTFDRPEERHMIKTEYPCLLLRSVPRVKHQCFLILELLRAGNVDTYRRVGLFHSSRPREEFSNAARKHIHLV